MLENKGNQKRVLSAAKEVEFSELRPDLNYQQRFKIRTEREPSGLASSTLVRSLSVEVEQEVTTRSRSAKRERPVLHVRCQAEDMH